jgi:hypothetical protein
MSLVLTSHALAVSRKNFIGGLKIDFVVVDERCGNVDGGWHNFFCRYVQPLGRD